MTGECRGAGEPVDVDSGQGGDLDEDEWEGSFNFIMFIGWVGLLMFGLNCGSHRWLWRINNEKATHKNIDIFEYCATCS